MDIQLIEVTNKSKWMWALESAGGADIYYTPGYLIPHAQRGEGRPLLAFAKDKNRSALLVTFARKISSLPFVHEGFDDFVDFCSPYGYAGPIFSDDDPGFVKDFWESWSQTAIDMGGVSDFIRFHPLIRNYLQLCEEIDIELAGHTVYLDLAKDKVENGLAKSCMRDIRVAYKNDLEFELLNPVEWINPFMEMYTSTMVRRSASQYYMFDEDYFMRLIDELLDRVWMTRVHRQGKTAAFGLFLRHDPFMHYHLGCMDWEMRAMCPTNLLLYETALLAKKRGKHFFHLGGGYKDSVGLYEFKKKFSKLTADFYLGKVIYNQPVYDKLVDIRKKASSVKILLDYFPAYRSAL